MFRALLKKYLAESMLLWAACAAMLTIFPWVRIWTVCQFDLSGFAPLLEQFRAFEKFSPVPLEQYLTYEGMIALTFDEPILILCIVVWSIARGSDLVSGEIGRGTMEMLLAQPTSRLRIAAAHGLISLVGLMLLCVAAFVGIYLGIESNSIPVTRPGASVTIPFFNLEIPWSTPQKTIEPLRDLISPWLFLPATVNLFSFGFFIFALSVLASSLDQYRWRTIGVVIGIYVLQLLLFILAKSTVKLNGLTPFSFFSAYQPDWITRLATHHPQQSWAMAVQLNETTNAWVPGPLGCSSVLCGMGIAMYAVACVAFSRRDLPAPL